MLAVAASQRIEQGIRLLLAAVIDGVQLLEPFVAQRQRRVGRRLNRVEHARIHVRLERENRIYPLLFAHHDAYAPAGHRMAFRERVHLQRHVARALGLHDGNRSLGVADEAVGVVVDNQNVVTGTEIHDFLHQLHRGRLSRRHVGVVDQHHLHTLQPGAFDGVEIGVEVRRLVERVGHHLAARQPHGRRIGGVTRIRHQHLVALVQKGHADVHDALFRADERQHLRIVVQFGAVPSFVPVGESLAQNRLALVGHVLVDVGTLRLFRQPFDDRGVGRQVGAAHRELDDLTARGRFDFGDFAQTAREIVLSGAVQPVRTGDVDCFGHNQIGLSFTKIAQAERNIKFS